jgi:hypothetical protein
MCMIGRPYLYGLAAAGPAGVRRAIDLLVDQFRRTLQLLGVASVAELRQRGDQLVVDRLVVDRLVADPCVVERSPTRPVSADRDEVAR